VTFGFAGAALVSGLGLLYGVDALDAAGRGIVWFAGAGVVGWLAELCLGPALERVARERQHGQRAGPQAPPAPPGEPAWPGDPAPDAPDGGKPAGEDFQDLGALLRTPAA
jgi:hypothetical protein